MLSLLVPAFLWGADLELTSGGVRCGFSPHGGSLASVEADGVRLDVGQPSFVAYLYSPQGTDAELCEDLSDVMFATAGLNAKTVVAGNKLNFNFRSAGFPGLTVRKSYELTTDAAGRVALDLRILLKNGGDKPLALSLRTKSALLAGEGENTIYLPGEADGHDAFPYPGSAGRYRASLRPRLNTIGVADETGRGFVLSVPPRCASCLLTWLEQKHGRLATQEHYGTVETLAPGEKRVQAFRLTFVPDVPAALRELSKPNLPLRGELSPHVRKFETPPKPIVTIPVGGASSAFKTPRERLEKGMKVPLDILSHVSPDDVAYPHAPWFKPGRPIRLLYLYDPDSSMIVNGKILLREIAARTPIEPTVVPVFREMLGIRGKDKPYSVYNAFFGNRTDPWSEDKLKRVRTGDYDVVLVHRIDFAQSSPVCTEVLRDIASRGAGLVFAACPNVPDELMSGPDDAALAARVQVPRMRKVKDAFFRFVRAADGVRAAFDPKDRAANPCIPPDFQKDYEAAVYSRDFPYHDYTLFGITKAVRIASRGRADALIASAADGKAVIDVRTPGAYRLEAAYRDVHRYVDAVVTNAVALAAGEQAVAWTRPCVPGGTAVCELRLLDSAGSVVDAAAVRTDAPVVATLGIEPAAKDGIYGPDEPIRFAVTCSAASAGETLVAEFEDSDFRVLRRESRPSAATADVSFAPVVKPGSIARLVVRLEREGHVLARAVREISIRARPLDLKDVSAYLTITPELGVYPLVRDLGFDFTIANFMNARSAGSVRGAANLGLASVPRNCGAKAEWFRPYRGDDPKGSAVRTPCFSDPAWQAEVAGRIRQAAAEFRYDFYNVRCHWLGDECFLGSTVCYSPTCLKGFRAAMRAKYGTVAALNARWGTSFASFDDVKPVQLSELSGRDNLAPWLEHKMFMARQFADRWVGDTKAALNAAVPGVRAGPTGTAPPGYGWDWSQMMRHIDAIGYYGGAQRKLIHDFAAEWGHDLLAGQCGGGYTPGGPDFEPFNYDRMWSGLLRGANLAPHYFGAAVDGDYSATSNMLYFSRSVAELKGGIGKFWLSTTGTPCVAVLYSQPSLFAAMATTGANTWQNALTSWWRILSDIKVDFTFLSYGRLAEKGVPDGCRLLVLPDALALSDAERRAIAAFQARGGKVFADVEPGVFDEAGVRGGRPLADVRLFGRELTDYTAVDLGGAAGETDTTTFGNAELAARIRRDVRAALAEVGIRPEVSVTDASGQEFPCDAFLRADGENRALALHLDTDAKTGKGRFNLAAGTPVTIHLPSKSFVYDVRSGENLGFTDEIRTTVAPGYTRMYSLQRKAPGPLTVEAPKSVARGAAARVAASVSGSVGPQVFGFRVYDPDGRLVWRQRKNVRTTASPARAEFVFETAFNERPGVWRIVVRHVNTGTEKAMSLGVH